MGKTKKYYDSHPEAKEKKKAYDTKYQDTPSRIKYRAELNRINRKSNRSKGDDMDYDHDLKRFIKQSVNRAKK